jgi:hypothetical protein
MTNQISVLVDATLATAAGDLKPVPFGPPTPSVTSVHAATHGQQGPRTSDLGELLERASTGTRKSRALGERITKLMTELRATLAVEQAERAANATRQKARDGIRARVAELEAELAKAKAQLRTKPKKSTVAKAPVLSESAAIRRWAIANGVPCTPTGIVPKAVRAAYNALLTA